MIAPFQIHSRTAGSEGFAVDFQSFALKTLSKNLRKLPGVQR